MATKSFDPERRRFLTQTAAVLGAAGVGMVATPFLGYLKPGMQALEAADPIEVDVSKIALGQLVRTGWMGRPIWILHRTEEMLKTLEELEPLLSDPNSDRSQQPESCKNRYRSIKPEFFIAVGICTHLACSPTYRPEVAPSDLGPEWKGGFFCPCHGSRFDLAGRVFKNVPAPVNLVVPPHRYRNDTIVVIGEEA